MRSRAAWLLVLFGTFAARCGGGSTTPTPTAGTVHRQATIQLEQTFALDLDTGTFPPGLGTGADIWFQAVTDQQRFLTPQSGSAIAISGPSAPGFGGCATARLGAAAIPIESLTAGLYLCASTTESRIAEVRVVEPAGPSSSSAHLTISYTTYNR